MIQVSELAGFFAAHAIWCVSDGDTLIPILAYTNENDERQMERLAHDDLARAVEYGKQRLASNEMDATDAALIYDGRITLAHETLDALIIEMRAYFSPESIAVLAIPYTPRESGQFRVHNGDSVQQMPERRRYATCSGLQLSETRWTNWFPLRTRLPNSGT